MSCLIYLLDIIDDGTYLDLFYNSDHFYATDLDNRIYDYDDKMRGDEKKYLPIEQCHTKETIKKIFNLDENYSKIIDEYFGEEE